LCPIVKPSELYKHAVHYRTAEFALSTCAADDKKLVRPRHCAASDKTLCLAGFGAH